MNPHDIYEIEIKKTLDRSRRFNSMRELIETFKNLSIINRKDIRSSGFERILSHKRWEHMGCPDADYVLFIEYKSDEGVKHKVFI